MGLFGWKKKKEDDKPSFDNVGSGRSTERKPDFSNVRSGGSSTAAPAAAAAPAPLAQRRHTVVSGDSLSKIAKHHYGDAGKWRRIYDANRQTIGDNPDLIKPGQDLVIPEENS